jgi:hypothetical protein
MGTNNINYQELIFGGRMEFLIKYSPIMTRFGYFEAPVDHVVEAFLQWQKKIEKFRKIVPKIQNYELYGNFKKNILSLFPLKSDCDRYLFIQTKSRWTLYLNNTYRGSDQVGIHPLVQMIGETGIYVVSKPHTREGKGKEWRGASGARILEFYESKNGENTRCRRSIRLWHDIGKWTFELGGEPFPFEDIEAYKKRRKTDKFTFEMMEGYLGEFDIRPFDEDFYDSGKANLIVLEGLIKGEGKLSFSSFNEVRKYLRIDHLYKVSE